MQCTICKKIKPLKKDYGVCHNCFAKMRDREIKVYAEHYHSPISDIKGFNKLLQKEIGGKTTKERLRRLLGY